jgi:hypothetical protein
MFLEPFFESPIKQVFDTLFSKNNIKQVFWALFSKKCITFEAGKVMI